MATVRHSRFFLEDEKRPAIFAIGLVREPRQPRCLFRQTRGKKRNSSQVKLRRVDTTEAFIGVC